MTKRNEKDLKRNLTSGWGLRCIGRKDNSFLSFFNLTFFSQLGLLVVPQSEMYSEKRSCKILTGRQLKF